MRSRATISAWPGRSREICSIILRICSCCWTIWAESCARTAVAPRVRSRAAQTTSRNRIQVLLFESCEGGIERHQLGHCVARHDERQRRGGRRRWVPQEEGGDQRGRRETRRGQRRETQPVAPSRRAQRPLRRNTRSF